MGLGRMGLVVTRGYGLAAWERSLDALLYLFFLHPTVLKKSQDPDLDNVSRRELTWNHTLICFSSSDRLFESSRRRLFERYGLEEYSYSRREI